jgi:hypothetical protein
MDELDRPMGKLPLTIILARNIVNSAVNAVTLPGREIESGNKRKALACP